MNISRKFADLRSGYELFEEIPEHQRLASYEEDFKNSDIWAEYFESQHSGEGYSRDHIQDLNRTKERWRSFCKENDTHPALATPKILNEWCKQLIGRMSKRSAKTHYLDEVNRFYRYLVWNVDYPHWYNPVQYAINEYEVAEEVWNALPRADENE